MSEQSPLDSLLDLQPRSGGRTFDGPEAFADRAPPVRDCEPGAALTPLFQVAGIDEVGRGPLAGPVTAAAVVLDPSRPVIGLRDSKRLTERRREELAAEIRETALGWSVAHCSVTEIDELNILQASMLAMQRAVSQLALAPELALIDGNRAPALACRSETIIKGDDRVLAISAASVLAKVTRDALMVQLGQIYPEYGFEAHKGYGTALHRRKLKELGVTPEHRTTFAPVRAQIQSTGLAVGHTTAVRQALGVSEPDG